MQDQSPPPSRVLGFDVRSAAAVLDNGECPFIGTRLNEQLAEAIRREAARSGKGPFEIRFRTADSAPDRTAEIRDAVRNHFLDDVAVARTELEAIFKDARRSGLIAVSVSIALFALSEILTSLDGRPLMDAVGRGLIILAWVALWHPADLLLYAHLPVRRRRRLALALSEAGVTVEPLK